MSGAASVTFRVARAKDADVSAVAAGTPSECAVWDPALGKLVRRSLAGFALAASLAAYAALAGAQFNGPVQVPAGTAGAPGLGVGAATSGLFRPSADVVGIAAGGSEVARFAGAAVTFFVPVVPSGARDLGSTGSRWSTVYGTTLDLSNPGGCRVRFTDPTAGTTWQVGTDSGSVFLIRDNGNVDRLRFSGTGITANAGVSIAGVANQEQLIVKGYSTQTQSILEIRKSDNTVLAAVSPTAATFSVPVSSTGIVTANSGGVPVKIGGHPGGFESSYGGLWFNGTPAGANYAILGNSSDTWFNAPSGSLYFRIANSSTPLSLTSSAATIAVPTLNFSGGSTTYNVSASSSNAHIWQIAGGEVMRLTSSGGLGIFKTPNGTAALDVENSTMSYIARLMSNASASNARIGLGTNAVTGVLAAIGTGNTTYTWGGSNLTSGVVLDAASGNLHLATAGVGRAQITSSAATFSVPVTVQGGSNALTVGNTSNPSVALHDGSMHRAYFGYASGAGSWSDVAVAGDAVLRAANGHLVLTARAASKSVKFATGASDAVRAEISDTAATFFVPLSLPGLRHTGTALASTLGSVTRRMPIYDGSGTLLGYIPIYDSIS